MDGLSEVAGGDAVRTTYIHSHIGDRIGRRLLIAVAVSVLDDPDDRLGFQGRYVLRCSVTDDLGHLHSALVAASP